MKRLKRLKQMTYCLFGALLLNSCEYRIHENFVELEKPSAEVQMGIELNVDNDGETIVVMSRSGQIPYNLATNGLKPIGCIFRIGDQSVRMPGGSGRLDLWNFNLPEDNYTLTCEIYLYTGTGSIAEQSGQESYMGKYEWPLKIADPGDYSRKLRHRVNEDGYLEVSWDKIPLGASTFAYYRVSTNYKEIIVRDINQTSFVDRSYVGGWNGYRVEAHFSDQRESWFCGYLDLEGGPDLKIDYSRKDSIVINWTNPYRAVISIQDESGTWIVKESPNRTFCIPYGAFGAREEAYSFYLEAENPKDRDERMFCHDYQLINRSRGTCIAPEGNWPRIGYNSLLSQLYVSSYNEVTSWSIPSLEPTGKRGNLLLHVYGYGFSSSTEKIVVHESDIIYIMNGNDLSKEVTIPVDGNQWIPGKPLLTADNKLLFVAVYPLKLRVYNALSGDLEYSFDIPVRTYGDVQTRITPDGKFAYYVYDWGEIGVLTLDNYRVTGQSVIRTSFQFWCVNPIRSEQLFISNKGSLTRYDSRNKSVTGHWNIPADMQVSNIDPESGLLLLYGQEKAIIFNPANGREMYSLPVSSGHSYWLYGNTLISNTGYALYLGEELKR
ncbi:MAG: hypothetical protein LBV32_11190 [Tannerellaceae bacterium]|jgi:hypothetical protein|nr:hypothetical protein [Tannerellaceae bacterium]